MIDEQQARVDRTVPPPDYEDIDLALIKDVLLVTIKKRLALIRHLANMIDARDAGEDALVWKLSLD